MNQYRILEGDVLQRLGDLPDESVHCVVTSPPYWGLRDYGTAQWEGGNPACDHSRDTKWADPKNPDNTAPQGGGLRLGGDCRKCGAVRQDQQIGLEATPQLFVARMVEVFREVRRVLRKDGTCWVNMGDSYANDGKWGGSTGGKHVKALHGEPIGRGKRDTGLKPKDLCGIPWRLAFALQDDGWWLRQDIIWSKPNPMPESVTDRCTKAHEYIFLLTKSAKYFYDAEAIKEPVTGTANARGNGVNPKAMKRPVGWASSGDHAVVAWATAATQGRGPQPKQNESFSAAVSGLVDDRNKRSVWTVPSQPYPEAHFATYPEALIVPCILAGTRTGGVVLDPFSGSGTTGVVALRYHRQYIGIELNPEYVELSHKRIKGDAPLFNVSTA